MTLTVSEQQHIENIKSKIGYGELVIMLAMMMALNALAIDVMLPSLDEICLYLHATNPNEQHHIIFFYLIGFAIGQLFFGPLSDSFGRRKTILVGIAGYLIGAIGCILAPNFTVFLVMRFIQGLAAASTRVINISIIRDIFHGSQMAATMSLIFMVFVMVPVIAPATGQAILFFGNWQTIFYFMVFLSFLIFVWAFIRLPETVFEPRKFQLGYILNSFKQTVTTKVTVWYCLGIAFLTSTLITIINTAKQVYVDVYHLGKMFPIAFAAVALCQAASCFLNNRLVCRFGTRRISHFNLIIFIIACFVLCTTTLINGGAISLPTYLSLLMIIMFCFGSILSNFNSIAMEPLGKIAGTASSLLGFVQTSISSIFGFLVAQQFNGSIQPLTVGFFIFSIAALVCVLIAENGKLFKQ